MTASECDEKGVILKVAFLADDSTAARWWLSLLQQSPGIDVLFLWCKNQENAEALLRSPEGASVPSSRAVWGEGKEKANEKSLKAIAQAKTFESFVVAAAPEDQVELLEVIFSVPEGRRKHVFSCTPPTSDPVRMSRLLSLQKQQIGGESSPGVWSVCTSFTHEVAAEKLKALLMDLGQLVGAQVICTSLLQNQAVAECGNAATLLKQRCHAEVLRGSCCSVVALLRELFGKVAFLSSVRCGNSGAVAARMHFEPAPCVSLLVDVNCPLTTFELRAWGVKGYAKLSWDAERKAFEVHRSLQHYEHPTLHPVTGPTGAMKDWVRAVVGRDFEEPSPPVLCSPEKFLEDLTTAHCLLESGGNNVSLKSSNGNANGNKQPTTHQEPLCV